MGMSLCDFLTFLDSSPSSFHAVANVTDHLHQKGFDRQRLDQAFSAAPGGHVLVSGGAVIAWWIPDAAKPPKALRLVGAHTDSPGFVVKPRPEFLREHFRQLAVEVYGGPIISSWFDRDLALAGRLVTADGATHLVHTGPIARIPHLAIHLYRSDDFSADRQRHLQPIIGLETGPDFVDALAQAAGVERAQCLPPAAFDLITVDAQPASRIGTQQELVASGRLDNLTSVWAGLDALGAAVDAGMGGEDVRVFAAFDHEEVGSQSPTGAGGPLLASVLTRITRALGADEEERAAILARSLNVSADAAHSVHPNYPDKHDPTHHPVLGGGPVTKINANQRYASTAQTVSRWRRHLLSAGVGGQDFVSNNAVPCGSTIGPITATGTGIPTVDVGVPLLSMHSARELCAWGDVAGLSRALTDFWCSE